MITIPDKVCREISRWGTFSINKIACGWSAAAGKHFATRCTEQEAVENLQKQIEKGHNESSNL